MQLTITFIAHEVTHQKEGHTPHTRSDNRAVLNTDKDLCNIDGEIPQSSGGEGKRRRW